MIITIHYDLTDPKVKYASHKRVLLAVEIDISVTTHDLSVLNMMPDNEDIEDIIIYAKHNKYISVKELYENADGYTDKEIRKEHNILKMFLAGTFNWKSICG